MKGKEGLVKPNPLFRNMKKKYLLPLAISTMALLVGVTGCNSASGENNNSSEEPAVETARKILKASLSKEVVEAGAHSKVISEVEGVTFRSSNPDIPLLKLMEQFLPIYQVWRILPSVKKAILIEF